MHQQQGNISYDINSFGSLLFFAILVDGKEQEMERTTDYRPVAQSTVTKSPHILQVALLAYLKLLRYCIVLNTRQLEDVVSTNIIYILDDE